MTQKLTKHLRDQIRADILKHRFRADTEELRILRQDLNNEIFEHLVTTEGLKKISKLPAKWFAQNRGFRCAIMGQTADLKFNGNYHWIAGKYNGAFNDGEIEPMVRSVPMFLTTHSMTRYTILEDDGLRERYQGLEQLHARLIEKLDRAISQIDAVLNRYSTLKSLMTAWPEAEDILKKYLKVRSQLPAIPMDQINTALKLPPEKKE